MASIAKTLNQTWSAPAGAFGWITQVNHKAIGLRFMVTALIFFVIAGLQALVMRTQLAQPNLTLLSPEVYNSFFTMHGSTMMFLFAVPAVEAAGIYLVPLMIGARDMAFPRLNAFGYWVYLLAGLAFYLSFLLGAAPDGGWFNYVPLTGPIYSPDLGIDFWVTAITFVEISALVAAVELIVTIFKLRAPGMTLSRMPIFVWTILVMSFMIVFAMPPLMLASVMLGLDRTIGTHFFNPVAGGEPLLWQHIFWFFGHPDVYIILLPALGIISSIVPVFARKPLFGYTFVVLAIVAIGFVSFGLWVHHMFATGLPLLGFSFFAVASMLISIPSGVQFFAWLATMWGGRISLKVPMLYVLGFVVVFLIGGLTGPMLAAVPFDLQVHDTFFVVAHFHYVIIGGVVFPLLGGLVYWFPKATGKLLSERLGRWAFGLQFIGFNVAFFPMHLTGLLGMPRRVYTYLPDLGWDELNLISTIGAYILGLGVLVFIWDIVYGLWRGAPAGDNPWQANTLEWATSSPPAQYNFLTVPIIRSRNPLWDQTDDDLFSGGEEPAESPATLSTDRRETVSSELLDARPNHVMVLPGPSIWPLFLALATAVIFFGVLIHLLFVPIGAVLAYIAALGWLWPRKEDWEK